MWSVCQIVCACLSNIVYTVATSSPTFNDGNRLAFITRERYLSAKATLRALCARVKWFSWCLVAGETLLVHPPRYGTNRHEQTNRTDFQTSLNALIVLATCVSLKYRWRSPKCAYFFTSTSSYIKISFNPLKKIAIVWRDFGMTTWHCAVGQEVESPTKQG